MKSTCVIILLSLFTNCSPKISQEEALKDKKWMLTEMDGTAVQGSGSENAAYITFDVAKKMFSGAGGCNRISGSYIQEAKNKLKFGQSLSTKMMCPDMAIEDRFLAALAQVDNYEVKGNELRLKTGDKITLILKS